MGSGQGGEIWWEKHGQRMVMGSEGQQWAKKSRERVQSREGKRLLGGEEIRVVEWIK